MEDPFQEMPDSDRNQCDGKLTGKIRGSKQGEGLWIHMSVNHGAGTRYDGVLLRRCDEACDNGGMREVKFIGRDALRVLM
jgi:hypothetical protein